MPNLYDWTHPAIYDKPTPGPIQGLTDESADNGAPSLSFVQAPQPMPTPVSIFAGSFPKYAPPRTYDEDAIDLDRLRPPAVSDAPSIDENLAYSVEQMASKLNRYELRDTEVVKAHNGQDMYYSFDPGTGAYVPQGYVYDEDHRGPRYQTPDRFIKADRSDYWVAPTPSAGFDNLPKQYTDERTMDDIHFNYVPGIKMPYPYGYPQVNPRRTSPNLPGYATMDKTRIGYHRSK